MITKSRILKIGSPDYTGRVGAMYCFKHCDVNQN